MQERLGYIEGGSETLIEALAGRVQSLGGSIETSRRVESVRVGNSGTSPRVAGLVVDGQERRFDAVVSTVPLPYVPALVPELPDDEKAAIQAIRNVGVVCVLLKLKRPFTHEFAQTVCSPGFFDALPPMRSKLEGLFLADTSHYYPENRSISESLRLGKLLAGLAAGALPQ